MNKSRLLAQLFLFLFCACSVFAQQSTNAVTEALHWSETFTGKNYRITHSANNSELSITDVIMPYIPACNHPEVTLVLSFKKVGKTGTLYKYTQHYKNIPVWGAYVQVNKLYNHDMLVYDHTIDISNLSYDEFTATTTHWLVTGNTLTPIQKTVNDGIEQVYNNTHQLLNSRDIRRYFHQDDTTVQGKVFAPDPLSSAGVIYGKDNTWKNFNDSDYALLNDQRITVSFSATLQADSFLLRNAYVRIVDFSPPFISNTKVKNPLFDFTRKTQQFKDVMAFYHIYRTQMYLQGLNFNLVQYPIRVDPSAGTADQSFFNYSPDTSLNFGLGGVPDAEDADVIVHEYTHAVSWDINPTDAMSTERRAIEEALCDVMAAVRSKAYTTFNWRRLFNFDGPNPITPGNIPYWSGRNGQSPKTYENKQNSPYPDSEIWTSCLLDISERIGTDTLINIMLASIELMNSNTTMPEACEHMLVADSILYGGTHRLLMGVFFNERKFGNFPVGIREPITLRPFDVLNTANFSQGNPITIRFSNPHSYAIELLDMQGKQVRFISRVFQQSTLLADGLQNGVYLLKVEQDGNVWTTKIIKR